MSSQEVYTSTHQVASCWASDVPHDHMYHNSENEIMRKGNHTYDVTMWTDSCLAKRGEKKVWQEPTDHNRYLNFHDGRVSRGTDGTLEQEPVKYCTDPQCRDPTDLVGAL